MILIKKLFSRYIPIGLKRYLVSTSTEKPLIYLSGIQPSGRLHLGNYLGAIKPLVGIQTSSNVASLMLLMADLHALTTVRCPQSLLRNMQHLWTTLVACGINPILDKGENASGKTVIFQQSSIVGHTELTWILACRCSHQRLAHLPQWREKYRQAGPTEGTLGSVGLFLYPVLQAADILLYDADVVPVGEDQLTHIELARDLARTMEVTESNLISLRPKPLALFKVPRALLVESAKIHSLRHPEKKMSKSYGGADDAGTIWLTDDPDQLSRKVSRALTDSQPGVSYDPVGRPGLANLIRILAALESRSLEECLLDCSHLTKSDLKSRLTDALVAELTPIRTRVHELNCGLDVVAAPIAGFEVCEAHLSTASVPYGSMMAASLSAGRALAQGIANATMARVHEAAGL